MYDIPRLIQDIAAYFRYENEPNATTQDQFQAFLKNLHAVIQVLTQRIWQPLTKYEIGDEITSPNLPKGYVARAISGGTSAANEPEWGDKKGTIVDSTVTWEISPSFVTVNGNAVDDNGNISIVTVENSNNATNANVASKLGTSNLGGASQPIYLKEGVATALSNTVGGTTQPIYMNGGVLTALTNTIGSSSTPLYLNDGKLTACSSALGASNNGGIIAQSLGTNGYVKFANGLILQWGYNSNNAASAVTTFPISYPSVCYGIVHCSGSTGRVEGNPWISSVSISQFTWGQYGLGYWFSLGR